MGRTHYTDYVNYYMRYYWCHKNPVFRTDVDKVNWETCDAIAKVYNRQERDILSAVYHSRDTMGDTVYAVAKQFDVCQDMVFNLVDDAARRFAKQRGLI